MVVKMITIRRSVDVNGDRYNKAHLEISAELDADEDEDVCIKTLNGYILEQLEEVT